MDSKEIVIKFNEHINNKDIGGLASLMHEDYTFIDSTNNSEKGKQNGINSWKSFFKKFPDYKNIFEKIVSKNNSIVVIGHSICSYKPLNGHALWAVKIKENKIIEWRIYLNNEENRKILGID